MGQSSVFLMRESLGPRTCPSGTATMKIVSGHRDSVMIGNASGLPTNDMELANLATNVMLANCKLKLKI